MERTRERGMRVARETDRQAHANKCLIKQSEPAKTDRHGRVDESTKRNCYKKEEYDCEKEREREKKRWSTTVVCVSPVLFTHTHSYCKYHIKVDESHSIYESTIKDYYFVWEKE
jgi:hypothetical protein